MRVQARSKLTKSKIALKSQQWFQSYDDSAEMHAKSESSPPSLHSLTPAGLPPLPLGRHRVLHNLDLSNLGGKISQPYRAIEP